MNGQSPSIGDLRDVLVLEQRSETPAPGGGADLAWTPVETVFAAIRPRTGHETLHIGEFTSLVTHEVWIRARAGTTAAMRFRQGERIFDILAVLTTGKRADWQRCLCREVAG